MVGGRRALGCASELAFPLQGVVQVADLCQQFPFVLAGEVGNAGPVVLLPGLLEEDDKGQKAEVFERKPGHTGYSCQAAGVGIAQENNVALGGHVDGETEAVEEEILPELDRLPEEKDGDGKQESEDHEAGCRLDQEHGPKRVEGLTGDVQLVQVNGDGDQRATGEDG